MTEPLAPTPKPHWVEHPKLTKTDVLDPQRNVTGTITITYLNHDLALVTTHENAVHYRGHAFAVSVHLTRAADGTWSPETRRPYLKYHSRYPDKPAPPTYTADLIAAITHTTRYHWSPELGRKADYANAVQRLSTTATELDNARAEVARLEAERAPYLDIVRTYTENNEGTTT